MNKYNSYKDSGIEWIGKIPSHWEVIKLKNLGEVIIGLSYQPENIVDDNSSGTLVMRSSNIQNGKPDFNDNVFVNSQLSEKLRTKSGDILICSRNGSRNLIGKNCLITPDIEGMTWGVFMTVYRSKFNRFIYWLLNSQVFESQSGLYLTSTINQLTVSTLENMIIPYTREEKEQHQIVQYLDTKTTLIDTLIQKTQEKIDLLREKRTSLINHTLTKGLNPNVEMKDSGVEWIGKVPKHWKVKRLKHVVDENINSLSNSTDPNYELDYIEISDVDSEGKINNTTHYLFSESPSRCRRIVQQDDVIVSTVRTYLRSIGIIEKEVNDLICSTGFSVLTPKNNTFSKHLFYMLRTEWFISDVISKSEGVSYPSIQSEKLRNIKIVSLPLVEQQQIVEYLDEQTQLIDTLIHKEEKRVELLKEYRQTLISDVVTGKIKVTDYE